MTPSNAPLPRRAALNALVAAVATTAAASALLALPATPAAAATAGSGRIVTETRAVRDFDSIALSGSLDIVVRQGAQEGVEIQGDDNIVPLIETVVESGRTLAIRFKRGEMIRSHSPIKIRVDVVRLTGLATSGSGDVTVETLKTPALKLSISGSRDARLRALSTDEFDVRISGSGDVYAEGSARQLRISIAGSGDVKAAGLVADDVNVRIAGSGDADVTANKSLEVSVAGSGDVRYGGTATQVKSRVAGSGDVIKR